MALTFADSMSLGEEIEIEMIDEIDENGIKRVVELVNAGQKEREWESYILNENDEDSRIEVEVFSGESSVPCHYCKELVNYLQDVNHKCFDGYTCLIVDNGELRIYQNIGENCQHSDKENSTSHVDHSWGALKNRLLTGFPQEPEQPDPEEALGTYLTGVLRNLPNEKNQMLQIKVLNAIKEVFLPSLGDHTYV